MPGASVATGSVHSPAAGYAEAHNVSAATENVESASRRQQQAPARSGACWRMRMAPRSSSAHTGRAAAEGQGNLTVNGCSHVLAVHSHKHMRTFSLALVVLGQHLSPRPACAQPPGVGAWCPGPRSAVCASCRRLMASAASQRTCPSGRRPRQATVALAWRRFSRRAGSPRARARANFQGGSLAKLAASELASHDCGSHHVSARECALCLNSRAS